MTRGRVDGRDRLVPHPDSADRAAVAKPRDPLARAVARNGSDGTRTRGSGPRPRGEDRSDLFRASQGEEIGGRREAGEGSAPESCMTEPADRGLRYPKP